ncbi:hypothetical protein DPEC_G00229860 [Dallia pectoralis]|uniref:Uncharacterized protein n=1 Tax=Dallia pectoralis TaxID=75939 RepID=A0ACC2G1L5_DALPE|nr:hypothetical protein DPEC_G00229860 [Dallia pectoralis]
MSVRRALVDCAVVSLQDRCVVYPCCTGCFSRVIRTDTARWRCTRCGYRCLEQQLDHRYRLSLRVTRGNTIFGVTVFGSCLNRFFGAEATHLHRLVEESFEPIGAVDQRSGGHSRMLMKAVEDCFVGRHFVFGIKLSGPLPPGTESGSQFIATQISLPMAAAPGCSVVSYYRALIHRYALHSGPALQPIANTGRAPLLLPSSPQCSFDSTLPSCGRSLSLHRSFNQTTTYTKTVPWLQSPGVITSSAEQEEEECNFQEREKRGGRGAEEVPGRIQIPGRLTSPSILPSPPRKEEGHNRSCYWGALSSFCEGPDSPIFSPASVTWAAPTQPSHRQAVQSSAIKRGVSETEACLSDSDLTDLANYVPWEDMPFSESFGDFVCNPADTDREKDNQNQSIRLTEPITILPRTLLDITNVEEEPRARKCLKVHRKAAKSTAENRRGSSLGEESDMVPPSPAAFSLRSTKEPGVGVKEWVRGSEGHSCLRTKGGVPTRETPPLTDRQLAVGERHIHLTLTDGQTNQCQTCTHACPYLHHEKKVPDRCSELKNEACDWSRDMFDDSF